MSMRSVYFDVVLAACSLLLMFTNVPVFSAKPIALPGGAKLEQVDFERHVMGVVGLMGCNGGACHGSFQGRGGFRLSLFGYDFDIDHDEIFDRVDTDDPEASYLLEKATLAIEHGGGRRFETESWQYRILKSWIEEGAKRLDGSGDIVEIKTTPEVVRFRSTDEVKQIKVLAKFADGTEENVTPFCEFRAKDDYVAEVASGGTVRVFRPGDTTIVAQYRGHVVAARVILPTPTDQEFIYPKILPVNYVDEEVFLKLRQLNVVPSQRSSDYEFLRRVYIDCIGRLPSPEDIRLFLADSNPQKRAKVIDQLLEDPLHAALWATKFSDITGNNSAALAEPRNKRSTMWHDWFRRRLEQNATYAEIVQGVLTATSREEMTPESWVRSAREIDEAALIGFDTDYDKRSTLDLYWLRRNLDLERMGEQTAAAFLGVRLTCARCHKHPYDRWSQVDYRSFANVFGQMRMGTSAAAKSVIDAENQRREAIDDDNLKLPALREAFIDTNNPRLLGHPATNQPLPPKVPGGPELSQATDTREQLYEWLIEPENPFFARSFVNRVWAHYFGKGIVHPVDDFSVGNPPSNERLLDALASDFVSHGFDIRHIERTILNSRTYQSSSAPNESNRHDRRNFARSYPRRMMAEVVVDVVNSALGVRDVFPQDAAAGSSAIEVAATNVRDGNLRYAFSVFGRPQRTLACDCERTDDPSLSQTLYLMADDRVMQKMRAGRLGQMLQQLDRRQRLRDKSIPHSDLNAILDELWLATLTRPPTSSEQRHAIEHVLRNEDSAEGLVDLLWALINTREFALNH